MLLSQKQEKDASLIDNEIGDYHMIKKFKVENFRCFKSAQIDDLRRINIIVGDNASGKTTFLEAVKMGLNGYPQDLPWFNQHRGIPLSLPQNPTAEQFQSAFADFFHQFDIQNPITTSIENSDNRTAKLKIHFDASRASTVQLQIGFNKPNGTSEAATVLPTTIIPLAFERNDFQGANDTLLVSVDSQGMLLMAPGKAMGIVSGLISVGNFGGLGDTPVQLSRLEIEKRDESEKLIDVMKKHFPMISNITVKTPMGIGIVYADIKGISRPIPLSLVSGGISRLFTHLISIIRFKKGAVLIDEIEEGLFYKQFSKLWATITELADTHKTQLFISSHSLECLREAMPTIKKNPKNFCLLRLKRKDNESIVERFDGEDLEAALEQDFDVRA